MPRPQFAMSTRAGCECVAHTLHALTEADPEATILSTDGISAFDLVSHSAMLRGLASVAGGPEAIPFVWMFCGQPSLYIWEDDEGTVHEIHQAQGGEQGDALMPVLFAFGQHSGAYSLPMWMTCTSRHCQQELVLFMLLWRASCSDMQGSAFTEARRVFGTAPASVLLRATSLSKSRKPCQTILNRCGEDPICPTHQQGIKVLGTPLGHADFVRAHLDRKVEEHQELLRRIPTVPGLQSAWLLLLHCAAAKATYPSTGNLSSCFFYSGG